MTLSSRPRIWSGLLAAVVSVSCARGADEARLQADLQEKLNRDVKPGLFEVVALRREGSAPLPASESGVPRVVVYYNATLRVGESYAFGGWDQLGAGSVAFALGATEKGVFGLKPENQPGDLVRAYGSAVYERGADGWIPGTARPAQAAAAPNIEGTAPPSRSKQLIDQLAALVELPPPGMPAQQDEIIADELARASENIERRVKRREHTFTIATGPQGGDYDRIGAALIAAVNEAAPNVKLRQRLSEGSVDNAWLLSRGDADYAIVQGDVAAAAFAGEGTFARGGPLATLRAVGGLFPEPIHVVVLPDSPIRAIAQLRGQRVGIGAPASGTRFDALSLLAAHGLKADQLREVSEDPPAEALDKLRGGQLDAVIMTSSMPARTLQQLAVSPGLRLLSIDEAPLERLVAERPGLARITLPPNTYPRQREPVVTVAATALLLTTADAPAAEVERVADLVFVRMMPQQRQQMNQVDVAHASAATELRGVTIPLHPGAARQPH